jgi:hypothetical protein
MLVLAVVRSHDDESNIGRAVSDGTGAHRTPTGTLETSAAAT